MTPKRYAHCVNVAHCAAELAKIYGENEERAFIAGLLHDITKQVTEQEHMEIFQKSNFVLEDFEKIMPKLWHGPSGGEYIKQKFGIMDEGISNAIRYHTTGRANMTMLEKIVFVADYISPERKWPNLRYLTELAKTDIDKVIIFKLKIALGNCLERCQVINNNTTSAYNYIVLHRKGDVNPR